MSRSEHPAKPYSNQLAADEIAEPTPRGWRERNLRAAELLRQWSAEDDGYDDEIYPLLEEELKDHSLVIR
ncbi:MAG: hypothetical protein AAF657_41980 [Acidobacteriota bacterium]